MPVHLMVQVAVGAPMYQQAFFLGNQQKRSHESSFSSFSFTFKRI